MATGNPPNNPPTQNQINQANTDYQTQVNLIQSVYDQASKVQESLKEQLATIKEINKEGGNQFILADKLREAEEALLKTKQKTTNLTNDLKATIAGQKLEDKITQGFKAKEKLSARLTELRQKEVALAEANRRINQGDASAIADQTKLISEIAAKKQTIADEEKKVSDLSRLVAADQKALSYVYGEQEAALAAQLIAALQQKEVDKNLVQNLKSKLKFAQANNDVNKDYLEYLKEQLKVTDKQKEKLKEIGGTLKVNEFITAASLAGIIKALFDLDQITTDFGRNLGISREQATKVTDVFQALQFNASNLNSNLNASLATIKNSIEANNQLNESLGTGTVFTDKQVFDQIFLTKQLGLQNAEAANLLKLGLLNEKSTDQVTTDIADQVVQLRQETGIMLNFRKVLSEVAKVSGQLAAQYKNNPKLLAQAVIQAQKLGLTLSETTKITDSLLNFESSIENELKAELLLGKQLNFEKARALALQGDSAAAAAELIQQTGGLAAFQDLNVIQQRALADSVGLTADEMANALKQQKLLQETGFGTFEQFKAQADQIKDVNAQKAFFTQVANTENGKQLVAQYQSLSLQEKFNALLDSFKQTLSKIVEGPLGAFLHGLTNLLTNATALKTIFYGLTAIIGFQLASGITKAIQGTVTFIRLAKTAAAAEKSKAVASAFSGFLANPAAAAVGVAGAIGAVALMSSYMPDIEGGGGGGGGITSSSPTGGGVSTSATVSNNREQIALLNKINSNLEKQNQKPLTADVKVNIAGKDLRDLNTAQAEASTKNLA